MTLVFALTFSISSSQSLNVSEEWSRNFNAGNSGISDQFSDMILDSVGNIHVNGYESNSFSSAMIQFNSNGIVNWVKHDSINGILSGGSQSVLIPSKNKVVYIGSGGPGNWFFSRNATSGFLMETRSGIGSGWAFAPCAIGDSIVGVSQPLHAFFFMDEHGNIGRTFPISIFNGYTEVRVMNGYVWIFGSYASTGSYIAKHNMATGQQLWQVNISSGTASPRGTVDSLGNAYFTCTKQDSIENFVRCKLMKFSPGGTVLWDKEWKANPQWGAAGNLANFTTSVAVDLRKGIVAVGCQIQRDSVNNGRASAYFMLRKLNGDSLYSSKFLNNPAASMNGVQRIIFTKQDRMLVLGFSLVNAGTQTGWLKQFIADTLTGIGSGNTEPSDFSISQNYPNPFNPETKIQFSIPKTAHVSIRIYDMLGRVVETLVNGELYGGTYSAVWSTGSFASGIYFYRIQVGDEFSETKKMMLIK